ncbi:MAG: hypothetical protein ABIQ64_02520 [Candidatus Saccharimonadales bacterium]
MVFSSRRQRHEPVRKSAEPSSPNVYRRSRTLTGSISSRVTAAVEHASQLRSPRLEEHDLRGHRRKLSLLLISVVVGAALLAWVVDNTIAFVESDQASSITPAQVEIVEAYLNAHPIERLPFMLNTAQLSSFVLKQAPEVSTIYITGDGLFMKHLVSVTERIPVAQWTLGQDVYYVDAEGVAYQHKGLTTQGLVQVKDETGLPLASQRVASRQTMQFIGKVVATIQSSTSERVAEVILPAGQLKQIDIILESRPYRIKLHSDRAPAGQAADVLAILRHLDQQSVQPQYVDARVEGKAFYR